MMRFRRTFLAIFFLTFLAQSITAQEATRPVDTQGLDGFWLSEGYGTLLKIDGDRVEGFEITSISCLPDWTGRRLPGSKADRAQAVLQYDGSPMKLFVTPAESPDARYMGYPWAASKIRFHRVDRPPATFGKPAPNTPQMNFDIFWTAYVENYPFFSVHGVDWAASRRKYRPRITDSTSPEELFGIFQEMIEPLHDAHTYLSARAIKKRFHGRRTASEPLGQQEFARAEEIVSHHYVRGPLRSWCNGKVSYGVLDGSVGYLRITAFVGYAKEPDFDAGSSALEKALDEALADAQALKGLVIDVRKNDGGSDVYGVAVASRLAREEYLAFAKKAMTEPGEPMHFSKPQDTRVRLSSRAHFHGPIVLLTGIHTVSAGETFTMALMGRSPVVRRVGENTQGVFSDIMGRKLPNGWSFGLPNEIFLTKEGAAFDGPGIPPDVRVPVFTREDLSKGRDGAIDKALEMLGGG